MSDEHIDPSGNTEAFQAFARRTGMVEQEVAGGRSKSPIIIGGVVALVVVIALIWFFATR